MSTTIFTVPVGTTQIIPAPALSSVCFQPVSGGTVTAAFGPDGVSPVFQSMIQSGNTMPFSFNTTTNGANPANPMGNLGKIQVTAATQNCTVLVSDLQQYPGSFPERQTIAQSAVAYTCLASSTAENTMFSCRLHPFYLKNNWRLEWYAQFTVTNSATVKTINAYVGPSVNSSTAGALEAASGSKISTNVLTSMIGGYSTGAAAGRNDGQTIIASNAGPADGGGWGTSTVANVTVASTNYLAGASTVEQIFSLTGTKATGTDVLTLDAILVKVYQ
jgi:hypothetical protein